MIRRPFGRMRRTLLSSLRRKEFWLPDRGPVVSFTFDDFPRSALATAGVILRSYGAFGTYYAAMGLMGGGGALGEYFCSEDVKSLIVEGHELGSHTFNHLSCRTTPLQVFESDAQKGRDAITKITGSSESHQFAYPFGHVTLRAKSRVGAQMSSCRSIFGGVNVSPVDAYLLRANHLYSATFDFGAIEHLLRANDRRRGWLVFYTHDVRDNPSPWGCKPGQFEAVLRLATRMRVRFSTVGEVLDEFKAAA
jgi:peptidoglycan/xylan/chitin deacetylase (PgdA/CDA1 family)